MSDDSHKFPELERLEYWSKTAKRILKYASEEHLLESEKWEEYEKYLGDGRFTRQRNLPQYKPLTEKEFVIFCIIKQKMKDVVVKEVQEASSSSSATGGEYTILEETYEEYQARVSAKIDELHEDYEINDLKANDRFTLEELAKALVTLENLDLQLFELRKNVEGNLTAIKDLSNVVNQSRTAISKMQDTLGISRKMRKDSGSETAREELNRQKEIAKDKLRDVLDYIYCEKCTELIANTWFQYYDEDSEISVVCGRKYYHPETAEITRTCGHKTIITSKTLLEQEGTNHPDGFKF